MTSLYITKTEDKRFAIRKPGSERDSAILPSQSEAIERAREMNPNAAIYVERLRKATVGGRDRWIQVFGKRR